jgi:hypothetical protein
MRRVARRRQVERTVTWQAPMRLLTALRRASPCFAPSTQRDSTRIDGLCYFVAKKQVKNHAKHRGRIEPRGERNIRDPASLPADHKPGQGVFWKVLHECATRFRMNKIRRSEQVTSKSPRQRLKFRNDHAKDCYASSIYRPCLPDTLNNRSAAIAHIGWCVVLELSSRSGNSTAP